MLKFSCSIFFYLLVFVNNVNAQSGFSSNLPIILIDTDGAEIQDDKNIARMGIIDNGPGIRNHANDPVNDFDGFVGIEKRGSSSQMFPKKSYGFAIWTEEGVDSVASILGMPEEEDWILYAPYTDKSLMRNVLTYKIANDMGRYASRTRFCEVLLNGSYQGVYVMMEKVKRDKNRVALKKLDPEEIEGENLTGGYIVKIDKNTGTNSSLGWYSSYNTPNSKNNQKPFFQFEYPKIKNIVPEQRQYIQEYITNFETALAGDEFQSPETGYRAWAEMESFIDFAIVNEITKNVDGYRLSTFMHKDKNEKLKMGPVWDFNLAFGNADYCEGGTYTGWAWNFNQVCGKDGWQIPFWWQRLLNDDQYTSTLISRWIALRNNELKTSNLWAYIDSVALELDESQKRNFSKWPVLGSYVWPNAYIGNTYAEEVTYLKNWIEDRTAWIDNNVSKLFRVTENNEENNLNYQFKIYPNPIDNETHINFNTKKEETFHLELHDVYGKKIMQKIIKVSAANQSYNMNFQEFSNQDLHPGVYLLKVTGSNNVTGTLKIIKR